MVRRKAKGSIGTAAIGNENLLIAENADHRSYINIGKIAKLIAIV